MIKRGAWLIAIFIMSLSLIITSCDTTEETDNIEMQDDDDKVTITETETGGTIEKEEEPVKEDKTTPEYGGVLSIVGGSLDFGESDNMYGWRAQGVSSLCNDQLMLGDWAKGPAGTGECAWTEIMTDIWAQKAGQIAESWDLSQLENLTITYHIRKGMHWYVNPESEAAMLVGGREVTAQDVVWTFQRALTNPNAYLYQAARELHGTEVTAPDNYTVVVKVPQATAVEAAMRRFSDYTSIYPPEPSEAFGGFSDPNNYVGSGPFIIKDVVRDSVFTFIKNDNYWEKDPVGIGMGNQLPYIDAIKVLFIGDSSTSQAALRTGKLDTLAGLSYEDAEQIIKFTDIPLERLEYLSGHCRPTAMRVDDPEQPFSDIRVRQALMMATDFDMLIEDLYLGKGMLPSWPAPYVPEYADAYLALDDPECPDSVKELYTYNPDKAKELLADAGYADGFKTEVIVENSPIVVDRYSVLKQMWAQVGIDLTISPVETSTWTSISYSNDYPEMFYGSHAGIATLYACQWFSGQNPANVSHIYDNPTVEKAKSEMLNLVALGDQKAANAVFKKLLKYVLEQAWAIPWPNEYVNCLWQPWLKGYHGEQSVGYHNGRRHFKYVWIDQDLKKSLGY